MRLRAKFGVFPAVLSLSVFILFISLTIFGCKPSATGTMPGQAQPVTAEPEISGIKEGLNDVWGTVKFGLGKYFFIPTVQGFDIVVMGPVEGGDAGSLVGKEVRIKGDFNRDKPNLLVAQTIDIKDAAAQWKTVYTTTDKTAPGDYFDQKARGDYQELKITNINKSEDWEGKGKAKVYGKLIPGANGQGNAISVLDDKGKEVARIIVDNTTEFASYYIQKLRLFDSYWFYVNIKDSVDRKLRAKNKEIFHGDLVFAGLY